MGRDAGVILLFVAQQGVRGPHDGGLSVEVAGAALALVVIFEVVLLAGALADLGYVVVLIDVADDGDPIPKPIVPSVGLLAV